jgi:TPR repeat protein
MECVICFNEFDENPHQPLILSCGHSFCSNCMSLLFQTNQKEKKTKKNKSGEKCGGFIVCPTCSVTHRCRNVESIAQNYALVQSIEQIKQEKIRKQKELEDCQRQQEQQRKQEEEKRQILEQEQLLEQQRKQQELKNSNDSKLPTNIHENAAYCRVHPGKLYTLYDLHCGQLICHQCRKSDHTGHQFCSLADYAETLYRTSLLGHRDSFDLLEALSTVPNNYVCLGFLAVLLFHSDIYAIIPRDIPRARLLAQGFIDGLERNGITPTVYLEHSDRLSIHELFILGENYQEGMVYPQNKQMAMAIMSVSSQSGHCDAMTWMGRHICGSSAAELYSTALRNAFDWTMYAATEYDQPQAQCRLGYHYANGVVVPKDLRESIKWYKKSADNGFAESQCRLANIYETQSRLEDAIKYWTMSCEQGYSAAIFSLAEQYFFVPSIYNPAEAVKWYKRNIGFGDLDAAYIYAFILQHGHCGVPQDIPEAFRLFEMTQKQNFRPTSLPLDVVKSIHLKSVELRKQKR